MRWAAATCPNAACIDGVGLTGAGNPDVAAGRPISPTNPSKSPPRVITRQQAPADDSTTKPCGTRRCREDGPGALPAADPQPRAGGAMYWHSRYDKPPPHAWIRRAVAESVAEL